MPALVGRASPLLDRLTSGTTPANDERWPTIVVHAARDQRVRVDVADRLAAGLGAMLSACRASALACALVDLLVGSGSRRSRSSGRESAPSAASVAANSRPRSVFKRLTAL